MIPKDNKYSKNRYSIGFILNFEIGIHIKTISISAVGGLH